MQIVTLLIAKFTVLMWLRVNNKCRDYSKLFMSNSDLLVLPHPNCNLLSLFLHYLPGKARTINNRICRNYQVRNYLVYCYCLAELIIGNVTARWEVSRPLSARDMVREHSLRLCWSLQITKSGCPSRWVYRLRPHIGNYYVVVTCSERYNDLREIRNYRFSNKLSTGITVHWLFYLSTIMK